MFDAYPLLNSLLIDPRGESLGGFRWPYLIFNTIEALCWLGIALSASLHWPLVLSKR